MGNISRRHNLAPASERSLTTTWKEFINSHIDTLAGADFFTVEVLTWRGLVTYYVLFFIDVGSRRVSLGITRYPDSCWMEQVSRNATIQETGYLSGCRYLLLRSRQEVLSRIPRDSCGGRCGVHAATSEKSKPERPRGAPGTFDADPLRGKVVATRSFELPRTLSPRKKPPRQGQSLA